MKLTLTVEIPDKLARVVSENAIERVINSSIRLAEDAPNHQDAYSVQTDWREAKTTVVTLWVRLQDAIFRHVNNMEPQS